MERFPALLLVLSFCIVCGLSQRAVGQTESSADVIPERPRLTIGAAFAGQYLNDYRGSSETQLQAYPIPFLIYRGKIIKADRGGVRADFISNQQMELNFSVAGALNGKSDNNALREGMPELESAIEIGPSLNINLTGEDFSEGWQLRLPVRSVLTISREGVHGIGYTFNPKFTYSSPGAIAGWRAKFNLGLFFATEHYHDYYYSVDSQYVTAERPYYQAEEGFSGYFAKTTLYRRYGEVIFGLSLQYDNLTGVVFEDSPLVETKNYYSFSFIVAKSFWNKF
ncbi:hypothetical protein TDB9533_00351 [Thalassocella blandensis]|nr:hypothetical protein TDB9533_00351 [Thalassocella blandensis]